MTLKLALVDSDGNSPNIPLPTHQAWKDTEMSMERSLVGLGTYLLLVLSALSAPASAQKSSDTRVNQNFPGSSFASRAQLAASGDRVYVVWWDDRNDSSDIYFNRSLDGGATWMPEDVHIDHAPVGGKAFKPCIAASGDSVYVAWEDIRTGPGTTPDIYFNRSTDAGRTWLTFDRRLDTLPPGSRTSSDPQIAISENSVYVVWHRGGAFFNRSLDGGLSWLSSDIQVDTGGRDVLGSQIAAEGDSVYVTWLDRRNNGSTIYANVSGDRGSTWKATDVKLSHKGLTARNPKLAVADDYVYVAWAAASDIYINRSRNRGVSWPFFESQVNDVILPPSRSYSVAPHIAASGEYVYVAWEDYRNWQSGPTVRDIYFNASSNRAATWFESDIRLDSDRAGMGESRSPRLVAVDRSVYAVWIDGTYRGASDPGDIYFNRSSNAGATWLASEVRLDTGVDSPTSSNWPSIAASGSSVYTVWTDERNTKPDVYFTIPFGSQPYSVGFAGRGRIVPKLQGNDCLTLGSSFTITIEDGLGGVSGLLGIGGPSSRAALPMFGAWLLVNPIELVMPIRLNGPVGAEGAGSISIKCPIPQNTALLGYSIHMQALLFDPNGEHGLTWTNGLEAWIL